MTCRSIKKTNFINHIMVLENKLLALGIIILLVAIVAILVVIQGYVMSKFNLNTRLTGRKGKKGSTIFMDEGEGEKKCEICYGKIENDPVAECKCGKIFHDACAKPTGACPYCGTSYAKMTVREPERTRCPACGRFLKGNICSCGAVIPRKDETFICKCGNIVDSDKPVCKKCGAVYEPVTMKIYNEK